MACAYEKHILFVIKLKFSSHKNIEQHTISVFVFNEFLISKLLCINIELHRPN